MADQATLQTWLTEAETALHQLQTGASAASVTHKGKAATFRKTDVPTLRAYIAELKMRLGLGGRRSPPMGVMFK